MAAGGDDANPARIRSRLLKDAQQDEGVGAMAGAAARGDAFLSFMLQGIEREIEESRSMRASSGGDANRESGDEESAAAARATPDAFREVGGAPWPPDEEAVARLSKAERARLARHEAEALASSASVRADRSAAVERAVKAGRRATDATAALVGHHHHEAGEDGEGRRREAEGGRAVAEAELAVHSVDWERRVDRAIAAIEKQAEEFAAQWTHVEEHGVLPQEQRRVAADQLLEAIGTIAFAVRGLSEQMHASQAVGHDTDDEDSLSTEERWQREVMALPCAVATFHRWGLAVPAELQSLSDAEVECLARTCALAATDPHAAEAGVDVTVQQLLAALVVAGGDAALRHLTWLDTTLLELEKHHFDSDTFFAAKMGELGLKYMWDVLPAVWKRPVGPVDPLCRHIDTVMRIYAERRNGVTSTLVSDILHDLQTYATTRARAVEEDGGKQALAALAAMRKEIPQRKPSVLPGAAPPIGEGVKQPPTDAAMTSVALARAPPPTALEYAVFKQLHASSASIRLYRLMSSVVSRTGPRMVVLPGGVKKLARTVFKSAVKYGCDLSRITDQVRCTVVVDTLAEAAAVLRTLLDAEGLAVIRLKNRFADDYDTAPGGGYVDIQLMVEFQEENGRRAMGEVQINLWRMLRIKEAVGGGHAIFKFARSMRAYDEAAYMYHGLLTATVVAQIEAGAILETSFVGRASPPEDSDSESEEEGADAAAAAHGEGERDCDQTTRLESRRAVYAEGIGGAFKSAVSSAECRLRAVSLSGTMDDDELVEIVCQGLQRPGTVKKLVFQFPFPLGASGAVHVAKVLSHNDALEMVELGGDKTVGDDGAIALADALKKNATVTDISVYTCGIGDAGAAAVADALSANTTIKSINLWCNEIGSAGATALGDALKVNTTLTLFTLGNNKSIGAKGAASVATALAVNTALTSVNLSLITMRDTAVALADALKVNTTLTSIDLRECALGLDGATALADALKVNTALTSIDLRNNGLSDAGAAALAGALKVNATLQSIRLGNNKIGDVGVAALADALKTNGSLTSIDLWLNDVDNSGVCVLADALKVNTALKSLNMSNNGIGDVGANALADALRVNATLSSIELEGSLFKSKIRKDGAAALADAIKVNTALTSIDLGSHEIGEAGAAALADALMVNAALKSIGLWNAEIGDDGAIALAPALKVNTTLKSIALRRNQIGDDGAAALADAIKVNTTLTSIDLRFNDEIGDAGRTALASARRAGVELQLS